MTNIETIKFNAKFSVTYMNGQYVISGFNHRDSLHVKEEDFRMVVRDMPGMEEEEWLNYIEEIREWQMED